MKKILYVSPHLSTGGLPQYLCKKIEHFNSDYDIWCIEYSNYSDEYVVQKDKIREILGDKLITLAGEKSAIIEIISDLSPDIIHFEEIPETFIDGFILDNIYSSERDYKILVTTHSSNTDPRHLLYLADKFILVSEWSLSVFKNSLGDSIPLDIWEYPIQKRNEIDKDFFKNKLEFDDDYVHILNVGLFTPGKNQGEIFNLAKKLKDYKIKFHFVGNLAQNFESYWGPLLREKPDNCIIHGEKSNVDDFYQACDAFYFSSNFELNPLVIKEALSFQLPVFAKKLHTYLNTYDENVNYIIGDVEVDSQLLVSKLKPKKEIFGWFSYGELYDFFVDDSVNGSKIVEIGSFFGKSTDYLIKKIDESGKDIKLFCIDTFEGTQNEEFHLGLINQHGGDIYEDFCNNINKDKVTILKDYSSNCCDFFDNCSVDYLMIDGDHSYEGVTSDINNYFYKIRPGGYICGDDYNVFASTTKAVNDFFNGCNKLTKNNKNWYYRVPRVQIIHISTLPETERIKNSINNIEHLKTYGFDIKRIVNERYSGDLNLQNYRISDTSNVKPGHYGCYLAHTGALKEIDDVNYDYTIIMEEDAYLSSGLREFADAIHKAIFVCEKEEVYFVGFGNTNQIEPEEFYNDYIKCWHHNLAHCYLIPNRYKKWYIDKILNTKWDVADIWYNHIFNIDRKTRLATKKIYSKQLSGMSLIDNVYKKYKDGLMI